MFILTKLQYSCSFLRSTIKPNHVSAVQKTFLRSLAVRRYSDLPRLRPHPFKEGKLLKKDEIPAGYNIIYRAPMQYYFAVARHITTISAVLVGGMAIFATVSGLEFLHMPTDMIYGGMVADEHDLKYFAIAFVIFAVAMRYIVMRYPLRIYRNDKKYIAVLDGELPFTKRKLHFEKGDVNEVAVYGVMPWRESWYMIKDSKLILLADYFKTPSELHTMIRPKDC